MNIYTNPIWKWAITVLYPIFWFSVMTWKSPLNSWFMTILILILFCMVWAGVKEMLISTGLTWLVAIPSWWFWVARPDPSATAANFAAHVWIILVIYMCVVFLPQMLILTTRMRVMLYYSK
ncbi:hypothetical protein [Paenibacillus tundrae]|uniref:hypothetical protein n=1 Tax=Paenibacillus tundrae TaxID=528187 RepID=UPI0030D2D681